MFSLSKLDPDIWGFCSVSFSAHWLGNTLSFLNKRHDYFHQFVRNQLNIRLPLIAWNVGKQTAKEGVFLSWGIFDLVLVKLMREMADWVVDSANSTLEDHAGSQINLQLEGVMLRTQLAVIFYSGKTICLTTLLLASAATEEDHWCTKISFSLTTLGKHLCSIGSVLCEARNLSRFSRNRMLPGVGVFGEVEDTSSALLSLGTIRAVTVSASPEKTGMSTESDKDTSGEFSFPVMTYFQRWQFQP